MHVRCQCIQVVQHPTLTACMLTRALSYDDMACTHLHMPSAAGEALRALSGVKVSMLRYLLRMACAAPPSLMFAPCLLRTRLRDT